MYKLLPRLLLYGGIAHDAVISDLAEALEGWEDSSLSHHEIAGLLCRGAGAILSAAESDGLEGDLWHAYLTRLLIRDENAFSLACEGVGLTGGTLDEAAERDAELLLALFHYDFEPVEREVKDDCFAMLRTFRAGRAAAGSEAGERIAALCRMLERAQSPRQWRDALAGFYRQYGVGSFGLFSAFRLSQTGEAELLPVKDAKPVTFDDLVGCEAQKQALRENTEAFISARPANNVLLYGDSGTGKSTCVKALLNQYRERGLRVIEIYKHQFASLAAVIERVKKRNYHFLIFIDDLSFEEHEVEYKFLKAVIEGGVEERPDNVLICATSNRRHLIRETWSDRNDMEFNDDVHRSDTLEEKLSLSQRFGLLIHFESPDRKRFLEIVDNLARRRGLTVDEASLHAKANAWELRHGGLSGRTARQFVDDLVGRS